MKTHLRETLVFVDAAISIWKSVILGATNKNGDLVKCQFHLLNTLSHNKFNEQGYYTI